MKHGSLACVMTNDYESVHVYVCEEGTGKRVYYICLYLNLGDLMELRGVPLRCERGFGK